MRRISLTSSPVRLLLFLLLLLIALEIMVGGHSLCFNFTIKSLSRPGQPWCEAQVFLNKNLFLQYNSDNNMVKPLGLLGKKVYATSTWGELTQTLGEVGRDLRMLLCDIKPQIKTSDPSTLQVEMFCQREAERCTGASWQFATNGEKSLLFDAMNMTWTVINHEAMSPVNASDIHWSSSSLPDRWIILGAFILLVLMGIVLICVWWQNGEWQAGLWPLRTS
uniref:Isoform 5 of Retinoic acid early transcript 1E n=1 Tax=Homo sapiens TaxID=9606 RepID=Q8TD07-5